jgi:ferredoxin
MPSEVNESVSDLAPVKIFIHPAVCDGAGVCARTAPDYFQLGTDGKSFAKTQQVLTKDLTSLQQAEASCPYGAIVLLAD